MKTWIHCILIVSFIGFGSAFGFTPAQDSAYVRENFTKSEVYIPMRDGTKLFTIIYTPNNQSKKYPFLMQRTCYSVAPYGPDNYRKSLGPSTWLMREGYIFVYQDVRGRYMSEGEFDNMRPQIPGNNPKNKTDIDESSDTFDTIEWLLKNTKNNNGRVGIWGISYPGHYSAAALPEAHPALKAASPQAPIADFFFDDFHHHGAYLQSYTAAFAVFGYQKEKGETAAWYRDKMARFYQEPVADGYTWHLNQGPLKNITEKYHYDNFFWQQIIDHPNYDEFWQSRNLLPYLKNINTAVLTVGGWFDAEDLYGPLEIYKTIEETSPKANNILVMGPWSHGDWARERGHQIINHIYFGDSISTFYQKEIERTFFNYYLKSEGEMKLPEAYMFDTGTKQWQTFDEWPPREIPPVNLYFDANGKLSINQATKTENKFDYISDPNKPVPYTSEIEGLTFTPRRFMTDDQRHASKRPDVLTFQTDVLAEDLTMAGEIMAKLKVALSTTDADFIVKLIDVYPDNHPKYAHNPTNVQMGGYQQLVRHEVFRARFRNSYEKPEPFQPNTVTDVTIPLQDILHTFKKGHRVMIQIHSTWFPYIDRNPQNYVENIYKANEEDFVKAIITVMGSSSVEVGKHKPLSGKVGVE